LVLGIILISLPLLELWEKRTLIFHFAILNIKIRFRSTKLGIMWAALEPMLYFIVLFAVFTNIRERPEDFAIYLITGVMLYHIFARGTSGGLTSLVTNRGAIQSLNIKKEFFPFVATVTIGILAFVDIGVFFGLMPLFQFVPSWTLILLPIPLFLLIVLILGFSYLLSIINTFVRDIQQIWSIVVHVLLFISPIFWELENAGKFLKDIQTINPLGQLIEISHKLVIDGEIPPLNEWIYSTVFVFSIFLVGFFIFKRFENKIAEEL
jgi:ABC-type polysaccharide/polyol phosphate export permease